jgi:hypothetical protein
MGTTSYHIVLAGELVVRPSKIGRSTSDLGHERPGGTSSRYSHVRYALPAQPVDATQVLNLSAGVSNAKVFRGRSFS